VTPSLVYFVGIPGAGKSTLMAELTSVCQRERVESSRLPHDVLSFGGHVVGAELGAAGVGTDALADRRPVIERATEWIASCPYPLVLAEGDRLASRSWFTAAEDAGYRVRVFYLECSPAVAAARLAGRPTEPDGGRWLAGSSARAATVAGYSAATGWLAAILDGHKPPMALAHTVRRIVPQLGQLS
jgi:thymidylate kinase